MKEKLKENLNWILGKKTNSTLSLADRPAEPNNFQIKLKQVKVLVAGIVGTLFIVGSTAMFIKNKTDSKSKKLTEDPTLTFELADKNLDPEKHWRNYFEEKQEALVKDIEERLKVLAAAQAETINKTNLRIEEELKSTKEKLDMAQRELASASLDLQKATRADGDHQATAIYQGTELDELDFDSGTEFDQPKSAVNYIPEGTYFTGHLLGGIVVSTGLNTPDENATPVSIKLAARFDAQSRSTTNLSPLNKMILENCRIMGSSYGDLSSERAVIRLEKLVCEDDGVYITSKIAGQVFGADGLNGVKGTVVATSVKHIKNAAIGGLISGVAGAAKGQDASTIGSGGLIQTKRKGAKDLLGGGVLQGASNAGDKIADYYLRQAEAMSPVLTVPSGVRINAQMTKGFFVGEISTHKKIKAARLGNTSVGNSANSSNINAGTDQDIKSEYQE